MEKLALNSNNRTNVIYTVASMFDHLISKLNECRKTGLFCDWLLKSEDGLTVQVHKIVLISTCPYFKAMFDSGLSECRQESFIVKNISGICLRSIIDYFYTGEIQLENLQISKEILKISIFMCMKNLSKFCFKYFIENINIDNCIELYRYTNEICDNEMQDNMKNEIFKFILKNLTLIINNEKFISNIGFTEISNLIIFERDMVKTYHDEEISSFIMKWITTDYQNRNSYVKNLMNEIKFENLTYNFLTDNILSNEILLENKEFLLKITEVIKNKLIKENAKKNIVDNDGNIISSSSTSTTTTTTCTANKEITVTSVSESEVATESNNNDNNNKKNESDSDDEIEMIDDNEEIRKKFKIIRNNICNESECQKCEKWKKIKYTDENTAPL